MKHLFGPVNSRRLGLSLGIDLLPANICNFNCVYCEVGATHLLTSERKEYFPTDEILAEIDQLLADPDSPALDVFTITATGEPTLHNGIGRIIRHLKQRTDRPVAVLTNGSLFSLPEVRWELAAADIVIPSLDAVLPRSFRRTNRPAAGADPEAIIEGQVRFRREFEGRIWLEILLVKGLNDSPEDIAALREAALRISPDRIQLNTVARPPLEPFAAPLGQQDLEMIAAQFPGPVEILVDFAKRRRQHFRAADGEEIMELLRRRPCSLSDICEALNLDTEPTRLLLEKMQREHVLSKIVHNHKEYFQSNTNTNGSPGADDGPCARPESGSEEKGGRFRTSARGGL